MSKRLSRTGSEALAAFHEISARMVSSLDLGETLPMIARVATTVLKADVGAIFLQEDGGELVSRGVHGATSPAWAGLRLNADRGLNAEAFRNGGVALIEDYLPIARADRKLASRTVILAEPIRSAIAVPVRRRSTAIGTIGVYRRRVDPFDEDDVYILNLLSQQAGIALDNAFAYGQLEGARDRLQSLIDTTEAIFLQSSFDQVARLVVAEAARLLPRVACLIGVVPPERPDSLHFVAGTPGWATTQVGRSHQIADTQLANRVLSSGRAIESDEFPSASGISRAMTKGTAIETARLIPLGEPLPDGRTRLGVLGFYREGRGSFSREERLLMDEFGKRVSIALHRAELLRLAESAAARLETAVAVAADLTASLDPSEVIRRILVSAVTAGRADRGVLLRVDGVDTIVEDFHDISGAEDLVGYRHPIAYQPLMRQAVSTRRPVLGSRYDIKRFVPPLDRALADVRHTATIPLLLDGEVTAALVLSRRGDLPFLAGDLALFQLIGNQAVLALRNARLFAQAQAVTRAQSDFLNMAAHELRTPLSVIAGYVSMMEDGTLGEPPAGWRLPLDTLRSKSGELEILISELLVASRLESGPIPVQGAEIDLREAAFSAVERLEPRARLLRARLSHRFPSEPVTVIAVAEQLARILDNLLNNALSYTQDPPRVTVAVAGGGEPRIEIRDHGSGIPREQWEMIFERFYRFNDPSVAHVPGTGLGLYISRQLALRMGGQLVLARSVPGKGSTFRLTLPRARRDRVVFRTRAT